MNPVGLTTGCASAHLWSTRESKFFSEYKKSFFIAGHPRQVIWHNWTDLSKERIFFSCLPEVSTILGQRAKIAPTVYNQELLSGGSSKLQAPPAKIKIKMNI
jgi:hypothetical protein